LEQSYRRILVTEGARRQRPELAIDLDYVGEPYTNDFRQLVMTIETAPASLSGLRELEDHGQRGLVRETSLRVNRRSNLALTQF
jgi:hypothetical protein